MTVYLTPAASAVVSPHGWARLPSGTWVTRLPLVDARTTVWPGPALFAHLDYETLLQACELLGAQPIDPAVVVELNATGYRLEPYTLTPGSQMSSYEWCERHDTEVWRRLALADWNGTTPVANAGKPWVSGALAGKSRLFGWSTSAKSRSMAPFAFAEWLQPLQNAHNRKHVDYSSLCTLQRATMPEDTPPDTEPTPETRRKTDAPQGQPGALSHGYRCSVAELVADAKALGTWRSKGSGYRPKVGDLVISARNGQEPEHGGAGHVERATEAPTDHRIMTIGGNEQNRWIEAWYDLDGFAFRGCIDVPFEVGGAAVTFARAELRAGIVETPGPKATYRISEYHAGARRGGSPVAGMPGHENEGSQVLGPHASDEVAWCASAASWCAYQAAR